MSQTQRLGKRGRFETGSKVLIAQVEGFEVYSRPIFCNNQELIRR